VTEAATCPFQANLKGVKIISEGLSFKFVFLSAVVTAINVFNSSDCASQIAQFFSLSRKKHFQQSFGSCKYSRLIIVIHCGFDAEKCFHRKFLK